MADNRPLSPHLQIYRWQWTMLGSILHRASGVALAVGSLLLVAWLVSLAAGPASFERAQAILGSLPGLILLAGWTWSLFYHLLNGLRHMAWDVGWGFELADARAGATVTLIGSIVLTGVVWFLAFSIYGGI